MRDPDHPSGNGHGPAPGGVGRPQAGQPAFNVPPATLSLAAVILAAFAALKFVPDDWAAQAVLTLAVHVPLVQYALAEPSFGPIAQSLGSLFTHVLIHLDWPHVLINLGFLLAFGSACERSLGSRSMLTIFALSAAGGAIVQIAAEWGGSDFLFGASGGVSGAMGAVIRLMLADKTNPRRQRFALRLLSILVVLNVVFGLIGGGLFGVDADIAWQAHLGGLVVGLLLVRPPRVDIQA